MKKLVCAWILACGLLFTGCNVEEMSTLREISRPYAGEYKCKKLNLGGEDVLANFRFLKLELANGGTFTLKYEDVRGGRGEYAGEYEMGEDSITFRSLSGGEEKKFVFPYEKGSVLIELPFGGKLLLAEFGTS